VRDGVLPLHVAVERMTSGPARVLGLPGGSLYEGGPADVTVLSPELEWKLDPALLRSKSRNTPFAGWSLKGKPVLTVVGGKVLHDEQQRVRG
jgi:dihydroorotase